MCLTETKQLIIKYEIVLSSCCLVDFRLPKFFARLEDDIVIQHLDTI